MKYPRKILNYLLLHKVLEMSHYNKESLFAIIYTYNKKVQEGDICSEAAHHQRYMQRISWGYFAENLTDTQFRRSFRMSHCCFDSLCKKNRRCSWMQVIQE